jgi:hypothetical protein
MIHARRMLQRRINIQTALGFDDITFVAFAMKPIESSQ